ncbi:hypothetical protein LOK49_LG01G02168 [Camellia lanceoleosa]|uniref:Uncharacterized protein n=1 Tax=Camellia lanceoleosa TaxID=1840588 RepID=A0ACC0J3S4_9ERIC|nr:hypothetical protein LOK49_LG01G02168 [Camellia lanceoleosa]
MAVSAGSVISLSLLHPSLSPSPAVATPRRSHSCRKQLYLRALATGSEDNGEEGKMKIKKEKEGWKIDFSGEKPPTPLLDTINYPLHMKNLSVQDLEQLAAEVRSDIVHSVSKTGGHLSASLGVVELTVALHHVFDTPEDKVIWDVGHQAYPHKILTGRRSRMHTIRKTSGLAGFPKRDESIYDAFGAGHSSTSISAGLGMFFHFSLPKKKTINVIPQGNSQIIKSIFLFCFAFVGMAVARNLLGKKNNVISVIGDGAMTAGQAYEAMNNAGYLDANLIVILNDNKQVSLPTATLDGPATPVGALSTTLAKLQASPKFRKLRETAKGITKQIGPKAHEVAAKVDEYARGMLSASGSTLFEELGLYYIGPVDGHNVEDLVTIFQKVKAMPAPGPVLIHIITEKGKGYRPAELAADKMHGVVKFDPKTGQQFKPKSSTLSYTQYFAESLIKEAEADSKIVAIHAAMGGGTGLNYFQKKFPRRCFDVGIAEQHAVTFAAGLATEGLKPFCAIYSSFLQRGYDQVSLRPCCIDFTSAFVHHTKDLQMDMKVVHDVDLQKLPVRFAMDRAGLVGADGPTHCGAFDIAYMACLPNMVVMAPSDEAELMNMVATAVAIDDRPSCFRFPRGNGIGAVLPPNNKGIPIEIGKGRILMEGNRVAILGYGSMVQRCVEAAGLLKSQNISVTVADARFCKPLDADLIKRLANEHEFLITVEEGSIGGFGSHVSHFLSLNGILDGPLKLRSMVLPDRYIDHGSPQDQIEEAGLSARHICATMLTMLGRPIEALNFK